MAYANCRPSKRGILKRSAVMSRMDWRSEVLFPKSRRSSRCRNRYRGRLGLNRSHANEPRTAARLINGAQRMPNDHGAEDRCPRSTSPLWQFARTATQRRTPRNRTAQTSGASLPTRKEEFCGRSGRVGPSRAVCRLARSQNHARARKRVRIRRNGDHDEPVRRREFVAQPGRHGVFRDGGHHVVQFE